MRSPADVARLRRFMERLGWSARGPGRVYLTGGATALLEGWRDRTVDVDIKLDPEPPGAFEAIARLKEELDLNVELASPDQFLPPLPGWRDRSRFIERHGDVDFFHYDLCAQALSKVARGYERDLEDVRTMAARGLVTATELREGFAQIEPALVRVPGLDAAAFRARLERLLKELDA